MVWEVAAVEGERGGEETGRGRLPPPPQQLGHDDDRGKRREGRRLQCWIEAGKERESSLRQHQGPTTQKKYDQSSQPRQTPEFNRRGRGHLVKPQRRHCRLARAEPGGGETSAS